MKRNIKRRIGDRNFIEYDKEKHFIRAYAVSNSKALSWDLFPPVNGYQEYKNTYKVSLSRQQRDWAKKVIDRDGKICQKCGSEKSLEAHHIWPQGWFEHLRYVVKNGITLCSRCHGEAYHARAITPHQFRLLTNSQERVNENIESEDFWTEYVGSIQKGRVLIFGLLEAEEMAFKEDGIDWFLMWAKNNIYLQRVRDSAKNAPIKDTNLQLDKQLV